MLLVLRVAEKRLSNLMFLPLIHFFLDVGENRFERNGFTNGSKADFAFEGKRLISFSNDSLSVHFCLFVHFLIFPAFSKKNGNSGLLVASLQQS